MTYNTWQGSDCTPCAVTAAGGLSDLSDPEDDEYYNERKKSGPRTSRRVSGTVGVVPGSFMLQCCSCTSGTIALHMES
jgi:hypothetical protein